MPLKKVKWLVWFVLFDYMIKQVNDLFLSLGLITFNSSQSSYYGVDLLFMILSIVAFTVFTMNIKDINK